MDRAESSASSGGIGAQSAKSGQSHPTGHAGATLTPGRIGQPGNYSDWFQRQVDYLRSVHDDDRRNRYLNGVEYVHGSHVRHSVEAEVERLGPTQARHMRDHSNGHGRRR